MEGTLGLPTVNPGKAHKYAVKIYKLCDLEGYTYTSQVYAEKDRYTQRGRPTGIVTHSSQIVLDLAEQYLESGRTVPNDSFYSSVTLAKMLLAHQTHLVGTLRKNRMGNPKAVTDAHLTKNEFVRRESEDGIVVAKWRSKREVLLISTKHDINMVDTGRKNRQNEKVMKPEIIINYNKGKQGINISDQIASYFTPLRKTIRWYHKIGFEFLLNTAVVNALIIFNEIRSAQKTQIFKFSHDLIYSLAGMTDQSSKLIPVPTSRCSLAASTAPSTTAASTAQRPTGGSRGTQRVN